MTSGTGVTGQVNDWGLNRQPCKCSFPVRRPQSANKKKGRARACGRRLFKVIVACRATFAPSLSLSLSACAVGRVGVPRPGQLVRLNNNFIAYTHTHTHTGHTYPHTHRVQVKSHQLVLCVKIGNISFISFIPPRTNEVVKCK